MTSNLFGYIIYNGFWNTLPPDTAVRLINSAKKLGVCLTPVANSDCCVMIEKNGDESRTEIYLGGHRVSLAGFIIFLDKDIRLCEALEQRGIRVFNSSYAISVCDDKSATHLALAKFGVSMPKTIFAPLTYRKMERARWEGYFKRVYAELGFPFVLKECYGSLGGQVYLIKTEDDFFNTLEIVQPRPFLCQQFISSYDKNASGGSDLRIYVLDGEVIASMKRTSANGDFRANVGSGGKGEKHTPSEGESRLALRCAELLKLDFAGVDILIDEGGAPLVCEVNSNAQMSEISKATGIEVSDKIMEYILRQVG